MSATSETEPEDSNSRWLRFLLILLYMVIFQVSEVVFGAVTLFQVICMLLTGDRNERLNEFSTTLTGYIYQVLQFICLQSDERPWPLDATDQPGT